MSTQVHARACASTCVCFPVLCAPAFMCAHVYFFILERLLRCACVVRRADGRAHKGAQCQWESPRAVAEGVCSGAC